MTDQRRAEIELLNATMQAMGSVPKLTAAISELLYELDKRNDLILDIVESVGDGFRNVDFGQRFTMLASRYFGISPSKLKGDDEYEL